MMYEIDVDSKIKTKLIFYEHFMVFLHNIAVASSTTRIINMVDLIRNT